MVGKTTLIQSLQKECSESAISAKLDRTAGIVPTKFSSSIYGEVTFYDFAGHPEYYASHDAFIHSTIKSVPPIVLILVNLTRSKKRILDQTHYWINFMANRCHTTLSDKAHMILVGSHADVIESQGGDPSLKISELKQTIKSQLDGKRIALKGIIHIDCTKSHSKEMETLQQVLKQSTIELREEGVMHFNSHCFYVFLLQEFKNNSYVTLVCILSKLKLKSKQWSDNPIHLLPSDIHKVVELCHDLNDKGHVYFIEHPSVVERSWLILDKDLLLHNLSGSLFAPANFPQHCPLSYSTGVVPLSLFKKHFTEQLNCPATMLLTFLSRMEYCRKISDSEVLESIVKQEDYFETEEYYFFPNLVSLERPGDKWSRDPSDSYKCGWLIQCTKQGEFFSPHFIQALLLRLVFSFTTKKQAYDSKDIETYNDRDEEDSRVMNMVIKRKCSVWKNGIYWQEASGVKTIIDIIDQRTLLLLMNCQCGSEVSLIERRSLIISMVLSTKNEFCSKAELLEYFMHPQSVMHPLLDIDKSQLFSLPCIRESIAEGQPNAINEHDKHVELKQLLYFEPYAELGAHVIRFLYDEDTSDKLSDKFLLSVAKQLHHRFGILSYLCHRSHYQNMGTANQLS